MQSSTDVTFKSFSLSSPPETLSFWHSALDRQRLMRQAVDRAALGSFPLQLADSQCWATFCLLCKLTQQVPFIICIVFGQWVPYWLCFFRESKPAWVLLPFSLFFGSPGNDLSPHVRSRSKLGDCSAIMVTKAPFLWRFSEPHGLADLNSTPQKVQGNCTIYIPWPLMMVNAGYVRVWENVCACMGVCIYRSVYTLMNVNVWTCIWVCMWTVCMWVCMHVLCVYVFMCARFEGSLLHFASLHLLTEQRPIEA